MGGLAALDGVGRVNVLHGERSSGRSKNKIPVGTIVTIVITEIRAIKIPVGTIVTIILTAMIAIKIPVGTIVKIEITAIIAKKSTKEQ